MPFRQFEHYLLTLISIESSSLENTENNIETLKVQVDGKKILFSLNLLKVVFVLTENNSKKN